MDITAAIAAMENRTLVEGGDTLSDYDYGVIVALDGDTPIVSWDSGVRAPCPLDMLRPYSAATHEAVVKARRVAAEHGVEV